MWPGENDWKEWKKSQKESWGKSGELIMGERDKENKK